MTYPDTSKSDEFTVAVKVVDNIPPTITQPGDKTLAQGRAVQSFQIEATDNAQGALVYSVTGLPAGLDMNSDTGEITGTPTDFGASDVIVAVSDISGNSASVQFKITIVDQTAPVVKDASGLSDIKQGVTLSEPIQIVATDNDEIDTVELTDGKLPNGLTHEVVDSNGGKTVKITGKPTESGSFQVAFTFTDKSGNASIKTVKIEVAADTEKPVVTAPENAVFVEKKSITPIALTITDNVAVDWSSVEISGLPSGLSFSETDKQIQGTPALTDWAPTEDDRDFAIKINAKDTAGNSADEKSFTITIQRDTDGDGNPDATDPDIDGDGVPNDEEVKYGSDPRNANSKPDKYNDDYKPVPADTMPVIAHGLSDSDLDALAAQIVKSDNLPAGSTVEWATKPDTSKVGEQQVSVVVIYPDTSKSEPFTATINLTDQTPPEVTKPNNQSFIQGEAITPIQIEADDNLGKDDLTYSATGLPAGLSINNDTGLITGTPTGLGSFTVLVTVSDKAGNDTSIQFAIDVADVSAPSIQDPTGLENIKQNQDLPQPIQIVATDNDGIAKVELADGKLPNGLTHEVVDSSGGKTVRITGRPTEAGSFQATFTFTDNTGNQATKTITINVADTEKPNVANPGDQTDLPYEDAVNIQIEANDNLGKDGLTYSATGLPAGLKIDTNTGKITGKPTASGESTVTVTVTDKAGNSSNTALKIQINEKIISSVHIPTVEATPASNVQAPVANATISLDTNFCHSLRVDTVKTVTADGLTPPANVTLLGGIAYEIECITPGEQANATIQLGEGIQDISKLKAYKLDNGTLKDVTNLVTLTPNGNKINVDLSLIDGGKFDEDNTANGVIVDPIYFGIYNPPVNQGSIGSPLSAVGQSLGQVKDTVSGALADTGVSLWVAIGGAVALITGAVFVRRRVL